MAGVAARSLTVAGRTLSVVGFTLLALVTAFVVLESGSLMAWALIGGGAIWRLMAVIYFVVLIYTPFWMRRRHRDASRWQLARYTLGWWLGVSAILLPFDIVAAII